MVILTMFRLAPIFAVLLVCCSCSFAHAGSVTTHQTNAANDLRLEPAYLVTAQCGSCAASGATSRYAALRSGAGRRSAARAGARLARVPLKAVGAARANRQEARQSRRAARGCN